MKNTIHRNTTVLKFRASLDTTATNAGEVYTAWKKYGNWHMFDPYTGTSYLVPVATLRILIAEIIEQSSEPISINYALTH